MKDKELHPGAIAGIIAALVLIIAAGYYFGTKGPSGTVDLKEVDTKDTTPLRPGQPGYRERTTDSPQ
ncbi:MAG: hypothetical protein JST40_06080 [Armatimonadetes bacterium]|nr:hypothetical protein [Armatimonadota bacterium]